MKKLLVGILLLLVLVSSFGCGKNTPEEINEYTVSFDSMGGSFVAAQTVAEGSCATKPMDPEKEGFTFIEWQENNITYDFNAPVTRNILLTAFYTVNEETEIVSVAFNADNGSGIKTVQIAKGAMVGEPTIPQKNGYIFEGWYFEGSKFNFATAINENTVLVAHWSVAPVSPSTNPDKPEESTTPSSGAGTGEIPLSGLCARRA